MKKLLLALAATLALATPALADWPEKPIKLIIPFGSGGSSDTMARNFQIAINENNLLDEPIVPTNVTGHFSIGSRQAMEAEPDGHTFLMIHLALMGGEGSGAIDFGYQDFEPVASTGEVCIVPAVHKDLGVTDANGLLDRAAAKPDSIIFGVNIGAVNHLAGLRLESMKEGAAFRFVQIGGGTANFNAMTGGQVDISTFGVGGIQNFALLPDGSPNPDSPLVPIAYTGPERANALPDVPTFAEQGFPEMDFCLRNWWLAPKGTPQEAIDGMAAALQAAAETDQIQKYWEKANIGNIVRSGDDFVQDLAATWEVIEPLAARATK